MNVLRFLFSLNGRVRRREFLFAALVVGALFLNWLAGARDAAERAHAYSNTVTGAYIVNLLTHSDTHYAILGLLVLVSYTLAAKRFHDRGRSGWWVLVALVPAVGWGWMVAELFILPGSPGDNRYGPHPTFSPEAEKEPLRPRYKR